MMISPESYVKELENASYPELIRVRDSLITEIRRFEVKEMAGDRSDPAWGVCPTPEVKYQTNLEYLAEICRLMHEKYNREYVRGERTLKQDGEEKGKRSGRKAADPEKAEKGFNATLELLKQVWKKEG